MDSENLKQRYYFRSAGGEMLCLTRSIRSAICNVMGASTMLELLLLIAIISALAGIIMFTLNPADRIQEANEPKYMSNAKDIEKALNSYVADNGGNRVCQ